MIRRQSIPKPAEPTSERMARAWGVPAVLAWLCGCGPAVGPTGGSATGGMDPTRGLETTGDRHCAVADAEVLAALQAIAEGAVEYFYEEHAVAGKMALHNCPAEEPIPMHFVPPTPPLSHACSDLEATQPCCAVSREDWPSVECPECEPGGGASPCYDPDFWLRSPMWVALGFRMIGPHHFHYDFVPANESTGYGACRFTAQAFGDLDNDLTFSTYLLVGSVDEDGFTIGEVESVGPCD